MYSVHTSKRFAKDLKRLKKRSISDFRLLNNFIEILVTNGAKGLDRKYRAHKLSRKYKGYWECHVKPDLLLIWQEDNKKLILVFMRTGSHSDVF